MINRAESLESVRKRAIQITKRSNKKFVVVLDGDRTLIPIDSTRPFFKILQLDFLDIKSIFKQNGYTYKAFLDVATYYNEIPIQEYNFGCKETANQIKIYPAFLTFLERIKEKAELILLTAGVKGVWSEILQNHDLNYINLVGSCLLSEDKCIIDNEAKGVFIKELKSENNKVYAFGDSLVDIEMLRFADYSYLVVNERLNKDIIGHIDELNLESQISFSNYKHPNLKMGELSKISEQLLIS